MSAAVVDITQLTDIVARLQSAEQGRDQAQAAVSAAASAQANSQADAANLIAKANQGVIDANTAQAAATATDKAVRAELKAFVDNLADDPDAPDTGNPPIAPNPDPTAGQQAAPAQAAAS